MRLTEGWSLKDLIQSNREFCSGPCLTAVPVLDSAQQGEALLWSSWLQNHPAAVTAPWAEPDSKAAWDRHAADVYYSYWEQYTYWAAQGWTADPASCAGNTAVSPGGGAEVLEDLFGRSCTLEEGRNCVTDSEPSDGGNHRKRPAASSQQNTAQRTGNVWTGLRPDLWL